MNEHTLKILEFQKITEELKELCLTEEARTLIDTDHPRKEREEVFTLLDDVDCIKRHLLSGKVFPDLKFPPIFQSLSLLDKEGTILEGLEIANIGAYIRSGRLFAAFFLGETIEREFPIEQKLSSLPKFPRIEEEIHSVLDPDGTVKDTHPALRAIKRRITMLHDEISDVTRRYMQLNRDLMQSDVPTQKDGRVVLPLKANFKGRIQGIIHESSGTGATLYIEPFDLIERNNELALEENRYRLEVLKILKGLTTLVRDALPELRFFIGIIAYTDSVYARARYSILHECTRAEFSEHRLTLTGARHPLLGKAAVPIDLSLDELTRILIITGPNTGGKTVALKTAGILSLMNQFGMHIPASEGSLLPLFDEVLADVGDDQSIEDSLSTFSGHMVNIARIIASSTSNSLVLLDELGAGTDPQEGSALALSILDHFLEKGSLVLVTTHHGVIKNYGATRRGAQNASVAFDAETNRPTYRIIPGLPGESHAIDTAEANGIPEALIQKARAYAEGAETDISKIIKEIGERQRLLTEREAEFARREKTLREKARENDLDRLRLKQRELELKRGLSTQLSRFLDSSRKELENLVKELKEGEITREKTRKVKEFIERLEKANDAFDEEIQKEDEVVKELELQSIPKEASIPRHLAGGVPVIIMPSRAKGVVIRRLKGNSWLVAAGSLKLTVDERDLVIDTKEQKNMISVSVSREVSPSAAQFELDLRGMRSEEAIQALAAQVDRALLLGLQEFSVIHGMGEGILQKAVHDYLKGLSVVKDYYFSHPDAGGTGKTIVILGG
ncbi:MAG TPA: endonuclease MutS2 [Spirochaetia bacterium]|nr:endonuclease MutS2 [Spirochaetia bacterium]